MAQNEVTLSNQNKPKKVQNGAVQQPDSLMSLLKEMDVQAQTTGYGDKSEISSLYQMPIDQPHGLDFDKITTTPAFANDVELIQQTMKQHNVVSNVLKRR